MRGLDIDWVSESLSAEVWRFVETEMSKPAHEVQALFGWLLQFGSAAGSAGNLVVAHTKGRVLGILGCITSKTAFAAGTLDTFALSHFYVAKRYHGLGIGGFMLRWLEEHSGDRLLIAYGYGGLGIQALYEKQWSVLPHPSFPSFFFLDNLDIGRRFLARAAHKAPKLAALAGSRLARSSADAIVNAARVATQRPPTDRAGYNASYGDDWPAFAASVSREFAFTTMRDAAWMSWRYGAAPYTYEFWEWRPGGALAAAAVTRTIESKAGYPGRRARVIVDWIASPSAPQATIALLRVIVGASKAEGHAAVVANLSHAAFRACLRTAGFWDHPVLSTFLQMRLPFAFHARSDAVRALFAARGLPAAHLTLVDGDTDTWYVQ